MSFDMNSNILIVDDSRVIRKVLFRILDELGFKSIDQAQDGQEALDKLRTTPYTLVISDQNMPVLRGDQLFAHMESNEQLKGIPRILMVVPENFDQFKEELKPFKDSFYIGKPFDKDLVEATLTEMGLFSTPNPAGSPHPQPKGTEPTGM